MTLSADWAGSGWAPFSALKASPGVVAGPVVCTGAPKEASSSYMPTHTHTCQDTYACTQYAHKMFEQSMLVCVCVCV